MIRPSTCLCMLLAAVSGLYLYHVKNRTRLLDRQIAQVMQTADTIRAHTGVLQAEWALQNDPQRLQDLADRFLALRPLTPTQFVTVADLDHKLPPIGEEPPTGGTTEPPADRVAALDLRPVALAHQDQPDPAPKLSGAPPASRPPPPATTPSPAPATQTQPPAPSVAAVAPRPVNPQAAHPLVVATAAARSHHGDDAEVAGNAASAAEVISRIRASRADQAAPAPVSPLVAPLIAPTVASVLGGARTVLAAPVPVAAR